MKRLAAASLFFIRTLVAIFALAGKSGGGSIAAWLMLVVKPNRIVLNFFH